MPEGVDDLPPSSVLRSRPSVSMESVRPSPVLTLAGTRDELKQRFLALTNVNELARLLEMSSRDLRSFSYGRRNAYHTFQVRKRKGGFREICEPVGGLKIIQRELNQLLQAIYEPRTYVHGFTHDRSVATNANVHAGKRWVLNVDLEDFFPTINFGRVRGMLARPPYSLPINVATVVAQLCCNDGHLPQGAPTSPVISNMIAARLDSKLARLARRFGCDYSRYADDLSFSTNRAVFPHSLAYFSLPEGSREVMPGRRLAAVIEENGFATNLSKVRLSRRDERQEVTGLTVNQFPNVQRRYVRKIRAMLHAWEEHGYAAAEAEYFQRWDTKDRGPYSRPTFKNVVKGHLDYLAMVRGHDDLVYDRLLRKLAKLDPTVRVRHITRRPANHLPREQDAVWLVYCWDDDNQGTAFELEGYGLVTCAHVLVKRNTRLVADSVEVTQPRLNGARFPARIAHIDIERDLAILEFDAPSGALLKPKLSPRPDWRARPAIRAMGWPAHGPGQTLWRDDGHITAYWHHIGSPRFMITIRVAGGASGGPVFDHTGAVVGVISHGEETMERAIQSVTPRFGMIPLDLLRESLDAKRLGQHSAGSPASAGAAEAAAE